MPYLNDMPLEARLALLNRRDADRQPQDILKPALALLDQKIALLGSFGAEPAVLLHMAAQIASKPTLRAGHWPGQSKKRIMHEDPMTVIVNDHGFAPQNTRAIAADLQSDFDPKGITAELLKQRSIRITLDSFADGRGFTLAARLRQNGYRGHLRLAGHVLADQYTMARRSGFDDVEIPQDLAARQPESQWLARADWRAHDYQSRLRRPNGRIAT